MPTLHQLPLAALLLGYVLGLGEICRGEQPATDTVAQLTQQLERMQQELAALRQQVESPEEAVEFQTASLRRSSDISPIDPLTSTYCADVDCLPASGECFVRAELVVLRLYNEDGVDGPPFEEPSVGFEASSRFVAGYRDCNGLALRARYWTYDGDASLDVPAGGPPYTVEYSLKVDVADFEVAQMVDWGCMTADVSAGMRYARFETFTSENDLGGGPLQVGTRGRSSQFGPTVAIEGLVPVSGTCVSLVGNFRASVLFGDSYVEGYDGPPTTLAVAFVNNDVFSYSLESQLGVKYHWQIDSCRHLSICALVEGQAWNNVVGGDTDDIFYDNTDNEVGFFGGTFSIAFAR